MANHYLEFSEVIENLTPEEIEWWENEKQRIDDILLHNLTNMNECLDFVVEEDERQVWVRGDECGEPNNVANIVQKFLKKFRPNDCFCLTWAEWCSKLRVGEFGGGALFVTANKIKFCSTYNWIEKVKTAWEEERD